MLHITVRAASLEETRDIFTSQEKQIINKELREIVLEPDKYPEILFESTSVTGKSLGGNQYDLKILGDLTLPGVTRQITIPTMVTITGNDLRAQGEFNIERSDFSESYVGVARNDSRPRQIKVHLRYHWTSA